MLNFEEGEKRVRHVLVLFDGWHLKSKLSLRWNEGGRSATAAAVDVIAVDRDEGAWARQHLSFSSGTLQRLRKRFR